MANHLQPTAADSLIEVDATIFGDGVSHCRLDHLRRFGLKAELFEESGTV